MPVVSMSVGRGDVLLHRGSDEHMAVRWTRDRRDGRGYVGMDLSSWTATWTMSLPDGSVVYRLACTTTSDGYALVDIPYTAFMDQIWLPRRIGDWRVDGAGPDGDHMLLGYGHWAMTD